jgi:hypothetical protein
MSPGPAVAKEIHAVSGERLHDCYLAVPESVPLARQAVHDFAAALPVGDGRLEDISLAVSEAVTAIVCSVPPTSHGYIHLTTCLVGAELWVIVAEGGCGAVTDNDDRDARLAVISRVADDTSVVARAGGRRELRMCFTLQPDGGSASGRVQAGG